MAAPKKKGLGRGLDALFGNIEIDVSEPVAVELPGDTEEDVSQQTGASKDGAGKAGTKTSAKAAGGKTPSKQTDTKTSAAEHTPEADENRIISLDLNEITPNENQPRKTFDEERISELAENILEHGVMQPIIVRKITNGYEIVAGERRYRAARKAGLRTVPCIIRELSDEATALFAIIENVQREDLNPIEEAQAIGKLIETYGFTQEDVSKKLAKSRPHITNSLRLLKLPAEIQDMVVSGQLSSGHARALVSIESEKKKLELAKRAASEGLSVREIEKLAGDDKKKGKPAVRSKAKNPDVAEVEEALKLVLGTRVNLIDNGKKGKIEIEYYSRDELERLIEILKSLG